MQMQMGQDGGCPVQQHADSTTQLGLVPGAGLPTPSKAVPMGTWDLA